MNMTDARIRIEYHRSAAEKLRAAYLALVDGGVQSYTIGSRSLSKFDLGTITEEIKGHEKAIDKMEAALNGGRRRKAVAAVIRDW